MSRYRIVYDPQTKEFSAEVRVWWWWELIGLRDNRQECEQVIEEHVKGMRKKSIVWEGERQA